MDSSRLKVKRAGDFQCFTGIEMNYYGFYSGPVMEGWTRLESNKVYEDVLLTGIGAELRKAGKIE